MSTAHLHKPEKQENGFSLYFSGDVAIIVIDRGQNRINPDFVKTFLSFLDYVESCEKCRGLITTGIGKFYCNGLDIPEITKPGGLAGFRTLLRRLLVFPLPTLAAINGHAFAGGYIIALAHDLRTMRTGQGWISMNEVHFGAQFIPYLLVLLREKMGVGRIMADTLVLGLRYTAEEAYENGMVHTITTEQILLKESERLLRLRYGKSGFMRSSLAAMKADVFSKILEAMDEDEKRPEGQSKAKL